MRKVLFILILFVARVACAQTSGGMVAGNVVDEQGKPMEYATVAVLDAADSAYVAGGLTDAEGRFSVNVGRTFDGLMLRVTSMGYAEKYEALPLSGPVRMRQKSTALGEVTVTGARKYVKTNATGLTVSMEGNPLAKLGSAADAIRMMPMIDASGGGISVLGKGAPEIYVNNRKLRDRSELNRMSPEDIKSVDIITTPTAKYGSSVTSVIIIHTKKRNEGLAGIISGGGSQAEVASGWANADFSYMLANGLGFYVNGNVSNDGYKQDREYTEDSGGGILHTQTAGVYKGRSTSVNATAGGSYDFGESPEILPFIGCLIGRNATARYLHIGRNGDIKEAIRSGCGRCEGIALNGGEGGTAEKCHFAQGSDTCTESHPGQTCATEKCSVAHTGHFVRNGH